MKLNGASLAPLLFIAIILLLISFMCSSNPPTQLVDQSIKEELLYLQQNPNRPEHIPRILNLMNQVQPSDLNYDGKIDCIDYSIMFRALYGSRARLIVNRNKRTGMNHMFVQVRYNVYEFIDVEPQGTAVHYSMGAHWGNKYDPYYNEDVTEAYGGFNY